LGHCRAGRQGLRARPRGEFPQQGGLGGNRGAHGGRRCRGVCLMKTFQVPVWFNIQAETQEEAWQQVQTQLTHYTPMPSHWEYVVEEPVEISEDN
jgi:hypothetical protein